MTDRAAEFQRRKNLAAVKRSRMRKAGLLPPLPLCSNCGAQIRSDRWLPLCSLCAKARDKRRDSRGRLHKARAVRLAAEEIIHQLRAEARADI